MVGPARVTTGRGSAIRRLPACLRLRDERADLCGRETQRCARLFRGLRGERQDPAEYHALAIVCRRGQRLGGRLRGAGERLDIDHFGTKILERGACVEVNDLGVLRYPGLGAATLFHRGALARRWGDTGGPPSLGSFVPVAGR